MVRNDVVAAMAAPTSGESICSKPKRTMLSRAAKRKAAVSGNNRSRLRQVLVVPFQLSETMPTTMENVPNRLVRLGRSCEKQHGEQGGEKRRAVGQTGCDRCAEPLHAFEHEKARDAGNEDADENEYQIGGKPKLDAVDKQPDKKPKKQRVDAQVGEQAAKVVDGQNAAVDQDHR